MHKISSLYISKNVKKNYMAMAYMGIGSRESVVIKYIRRIFKSHAGDNESNPAGC